MPLLPDGFYQHWRTSVHPDLNCHDEADPPPERWLQQVWRHQRLLRDRLKTLDGRTLRVLHPGFWNREAGPDFRQAVIQFEGATPVTGDVELDVKVNGWQGHHHVTNPAYARVVLHIVWDAPPGDLTPPVLILKPYLDAPLAELVPWLENEAASLLPPGTLGKCCAPLRQVSDEVVLALLNQAARDRLQRKASELGVRARHVGWAQTLREGLFTALGYKHNAWPMRRLAEITAESSEPDPLLWEARLLGLAGLLPLQPPADPTAGRHVKRLWDCWWRERDRWGEQMLPPTVWRLGGLRPANHPQRRLALAARWLADGTLCGRLETWFADETQTKIPPHVSLLSVLQPALGPTEFWAQHWTFRSTSTNALRPFLGLTRVTDIAVNVVLPWLLARAQLGECPEAEARIHRQYFRWPAGQDNALLRHARIRLFAGPHRRLPGTAAAQQGLLQIVRDFCEPAGPLCSACRFPDLVKAIPTSPENWAVTLAGGSPP